MRNRVQEIKAKGFSMTDTAFINAGHTPSDFSKLRINNQTIEDVVWTMSSLHKSNPRLADKTKILKAIADYDLFTLREVSDFFYKTSGIYARILRYMAFMYNYDWYVQPFVVDKKIKSEKILDGFNKSLNVLEKFGVKKKMGEIALKVLRQGAYYGYLVPCGDTYVLQELPVNYCKVEYYSGSRPVVGFNMSFFDSVGGDAAYKERILNMFPSEFKKGYLLYKQGKLPSAVPGDTAGWYFLDPEKTVRFTANGEEYPAFISIIPLILDLEESRELDKKRTMQRLIRLVVQKMPLDKNGELIFDVDEAQQLHNNAVQMLGNAIGVNVLTTFADVDVETLSDNSVSSAQNDDLDRALNSLYTEGGVSQLQFNSDSSTAMEQSRKNDEATMYNLLLQFECFLNDLIKNFSNNKIEYKAQMLRTTIYNYTELAKLYKEQVSLGYSKILPQIALGQSQKTILAAADFENNVLDLVNVFIPPMQSSTMNADALAQVSNKKKSGGSDSDNTGGRPTNESKGEVTSEKTLANREAAANN